MHADQTKKAVAVRTRTVLPKLKLRDQLREECVADIPLRSCSVHFSLVNDFKQREEIVWIGATGAVQWVRAMGAVQRVQCNECGAMGAVQWVRSNGAGRWCNECGATADVALNFQTRERANDWIKTILVERFRKYLSKKRC